MATNPNRPEYMDTVESTWGQSVADHVIRRYATIGERDADLAALTPADLEGQTVAITQGGPGTYLVQNRGGVWVPIPDIQVGQDWLVVGGASEATITFHRPFAGPPHMFMGNVGYTTIYGITVMPTQNLSATGQQVQLFQANGSPFGAGGGYPVHWLAAYVPGGFAGPAMARPGPKSADQDALDAAWAATMTPSERADNDR